MAYAEKRDGKLTGFWYGEVLRKAGARFRRRFETKKEAEGYEAYVKATGQEPRDVADAKHSGPTFAEVAKMARDANEKWKRNRDPAGQKRLDWVIGQIGAIPIENVTTTDIDKLVAQLAKRPAKAGGGKLAAGTINRYLSAASAVLTFARERGLLKVQPVIPWQDDPGHRIEWLPEDQEAVLVRYLVEQGQLNVALTVRVLTATGLRWSEFISVEPFQITSEWIKLDKTKTDNPRDVPIDSKLAGELRAMILSKQVPNYVTMRTQLRAAVKACGYSPKMGIHNLRHTTATRLTKKKVPTAIVKKFLGHKAVQTTLKYIHVEDDELQEASRNLYPQRGEEAENRSSAEIVDFKKAL